MYIFHYIHVHVYMYSITFVKHWCLFWMPQLANLFIQSLNEMMLSTQDSHWVQNSPKLMNKLPEIWFKAHAIWRERIKHHKLIIPSSLNKVLCKLTNKTSGIFVRKKICNIRGERYSISLLSFHFSPPTHWT